jgi:hypothetical protein
MRRWGSSARWGFTRLLQLSMRNAAVLDRFCRVRFVGEEIAIFGRTPIFKIDRPGFRLLLPYLSSQVFLSVLSTAGFD